MELAEVAGRLSRFMDALDRVFDPLTASGHVFTLTYRLLKGVALVIPCVSRFANPVENTRELCLSP